MAPNEIFSSSFLEQSLSSLHEVGDEFLKQLLDALLLGLRAFGEEQRYQFFKES